ncbi:MAG: dockerin type I domain-containing protein [Gemmatimonadota bacterium]|nr:dockerin type I domain-containing protein [Gemmatimonadota bacterium]
MVRFALALFLVCFALNGGAAAQETSGADFDEDGEVSFSDFLIFARGFGRTAQDADFNARLDLNGDGAVDFQDFLIFARHFGGSTPPEDADREPFDPPRIYVSDTLGNRVFVLDGDTNFFNPGLSAVITQPRSVTYSSINRRIYVVAADTFHALTESSETDYRLPLVDPSATPGFPPAGRGGFKMVLSPDHRLAYITEDAANQVEVIHLKDAESVAIIPLPYKPSGIAISPGGNAVYVGHPLRPWVSVIDGLRQAFTDSIRLDGWGNGRLVASPEGDRIYTTVNVGGTDPSVEIVSIDTETKEVHDMLVVAADSITNVIDLQMSRDGLKLYATVWPGAAPIEPLKEGAVSYFMTVDRLTLETTSVIQTNWYQNNFGVSRDGKTAYVAVLDPAAGTYELAVLDLENEEVAGLVLGFFTPFDVKAYGGKAALGHIEFPEITVF